MNRQQTLRGLTVVDAYTKRVGKVTDVISDDADLHPRWAVVKAGRLGGERCVPLEDSYVASTGQLVIPLDKMEIKRAPRVGRDHLLTPRLEHKLRDYYGVAA